MQRTGTVRLCSFCCRFNSLKEAADRLTAESRPAVFIAEAVGSCTDLVATVSYPLRRMYGDAFTVAPLTVVVDPLRAARIFGLEPGRKFSERVLYIYRKQLEEAGIILVNKTDLIDEPRLNALRSELAERHSRDHPPDPARGGCSAHHADRGGGPDRGRAVPRAASDLRCTHARDRPRPRSAHRER